MTPQERKNFESIRDNVHSEQAQKQEPVACIHRLVDVTNSVVKSGYMCVDCGAVFRAYSESPPQQKQESVAVVAEVHMSRYTIEWTNGPLPEGTQLYTSPPQRQPLTLNQLREHWQASKVLDMTDAEIDFADYVLIARDVEALHDIKENQ